MVAAGSANFEIQVMKAGRWVAESLRDGEDDARAIAKRLLANKSCEGARVIRNWMRGDGTMVESEVFCETREVRDDGQLRIANIEDVPPRCDSTRQYYALPSRMVMSRVFRPYLDQAILTPTELIHNYKELRRLQDKDTLVPSAVDRVAALQTKGTEQDPRERREEIFKSIDALAVRARRAEGIKLPKLNGSMHAMLTAVAPLAERDGDTDFLALVALSDELVQTRNWLGKLDRLCKLATGESEDGALALLDGVIADVLGASVVQEILGQLPGLGHAICAMLDLAEGRMDTARSEAGEVAVQLNALLAAGKLPASRTCLIDRAHRQLRLASPLYRNDPTKENDTFRLVVERLLGPTGLLGGAESADALTIRQIRMVEEGGALGRRMAMSACIRAMPDRAAGVLYLADLSSGIFADEHLADMDRLLDTVCLANGLGDFCKRGLPPRDLMQRATRSHAGIARSAFPEPVRRRAMDRIDGLLEQYLVANQIVERLDHPDSPLKDRATRLVQFCAAGVLPPGKALGRARERVLSILRQPNFDAHFINGITDPAQAGKALRDFHQLLVKAGFGA